MTTEEHEMWDELNVEYEHAYRDNPFKKDCVEKAIAILKPGSRVLDVGCGTGVPVAKMLAEAGMNVFGTDVAPQMVKHAQRSVKGTFEVANMVDYQPAETFDAIFVVFSQLGLTYAELYGAVYRLARTLRSDGVLVIGQAPAEQVVLSQDPAWDETRSYVEGYNLPFFGKPFPTLMFSRAGQRTFSESMGFSVLYDEVNVFQPDNPNCGTEEQQYIIAQRNGDDPVREPVPTPKIKA